MGDDSVFHQAATKISRAFHLYRSKLHRTTTKRLTRIAYPQSQSLAPLYIIGSFPESNWKHIRTFSYSLKHKELFVELWLEPGDTFRLVRNGVHFIHESFPAIKDPIKGDVNIAFPEEVSVQQLRSLLEQQAKGADHTFLSGEHSINKMEDHNEDATFRTRQSVGVADGVSAWRKRGIDGGLFAQELMRNCEMMAPYLSVSDSSSVTADTTPNCSPNFSTCNSLADLVDQAYKRGTSVGSSTVAVAHVTNNELHIFNLGDSQAMLIRFHNASPTAVLKTKPKVHDFSSPFQMARLPTWAHKSSFLQDFVSDGDMYNSTVQTGDLLLVATDGLWDNLFESEIVDLVRGAETTEKGAEDVAKTLATEAFRRSHSGDPSPFQSQVEKIYGPGHWTGGKPDDITVVAAWIVTNNSG